LTAAPASGSPVAAAADELVGRLSDLAAALRERDVRLGLRELLSAVRCVEAVDCSSREDVRLALRAVLCSQRSDLERFDEAFTEVFGAGGLPRPGDMSLPELGSIEKAALPRAAFGDPQTARDPPAAGAEPVPAAWSTEAEMALAQVLMTRLARRHPMRLSRRTRPSRRRSRIPDLRATVQSSLRTAGEPVHRRWRASTQRPRQLVLVCDVSGSMAPYSRMLLQYMQASVAARRRVEAFAFGTRLTRITHELNGRDPDRALERAATAVSDMSGGTRIGESLSTLNRVHGRRLGRGSVVVILSDGWDRGDPEQLRAEMARLRRAAFKLVWLNPLAAHPDYEPLTRGMQAAVPHTDRLLAGNSIASLQELADVLEAM
jgi:uncharacterized protein with von Willebrand factor type A (vWA) domain